MKRALISRLEDFRICEVVDKGNEFETSEDFYWLDVPDDTTTSDTLSREDGVSIIKFDPVKQPGFAENAYRVARGLAYKSTGEQLDMLFKELMTTGTISPDGPWAAHITNVKAMIPKDDPQAVYDHIQLDLAKQIALAEEAAAKNQQ